MQSKDGNELIQLSINTKTYTTFILKWATSCLVQFFELHLANRVRNMDRDIYQFFYLDC